MTILTTAALLVAAPVLAAPGGPGPRAGFGPDHGRFEQRFEQRADRVAEILKLNTEQRAALDKMLGDRLAAARPKMEQMRTLRAEARALLEAGSTDARLVGSKMIEAHRLGVELRAEREAAQAEFEKLLDPRQKFAWQALQETREMRREHFRRGGRGMHGGPGWGPPGDDEPDDD